MTSCHVVLRTATGLDDHVRERGMDHHLLAVEVEQVEGLHFARRATGLRRLSQLHDVRVRVARQEVDPALARTVVGLVLLRGYDPVPAELVKVHH